MSLQALPQPLINQMRSFLPLVDHVRMNEVNRGFRGTAQRVTYETEIRPDPENYSKICSLVFKHTPATPLDFGSMATATGSLKLREVRVIGHQQENLRQEGDAQQITRISALLSAHQKTLESVALCEDGHVTRGVTNEFLFKAWPALRRLRSDALRMVPLTEFFQRHVHLESVDIERQLLTAEELEALSNSCTRLRSLHTGVVPWQSNVRALAKCRFLEHLSICSISGTLLGLKEVAEGCPHLKTLTITGIPEDRYTSSAEVVQGIIAIANKCLELQAVTYGQGPRSFCLKNHVLSSNESSNPAFIALASLHPHCMIHTLDHPNGILGKDAYALLPSFFDWIWSIFVDIYKLVCCFFCWVYPG